MQNTSISALILSTGCDPLHLLDRVFSDYSIIPETRLTAGAAQDGMKKHDFDLLVVDFDEPEALSVLEAWNRRAPNSSKVAVAVSSRPELLTLAQLYEANMVLLKPLRKPLVEKTFKLAADIVMKQRRSNYRICVNIKCSGVAHHPTQRRSLDNILLLDISLNGLCMKTPFSLEPGMKVDLAFVLPESGEMIHVNGNIVRREPNGVAGVRFIIVSQRERAVLKAWLDAKDPTLDTVSQITADGETPASYRAVSRTMG